jgi:hypothetical protein
MIKLLGLIMKNNIIIYVIIIVIPICIYWTFSPMVGPLIGSRRTTDEVIKFINERNIIVLVAPRPFFNEGKTYHDWAKVEFNRRFVTSAILFALLIFFAIIKEIKIKSITKKQAT